MTNTLIQILIYCPMGLMIRYTFLCCRAIVSRIFFFYLWCCSLGIFSLARSLSDNGYQKIVLNNAGLRHRATGENEKITESAHLFIETDPK